MRRDVPPFADFYGDGDGELMPAVRGIHEAGVAAAALPPDEERELRNALHELFDDEAALETKIEQLEKLGVEGAAADLCEFCRRALRGVYGRHREIYRNKLPPEAEQLLPPAYLHLRRSFP